MMSAGPDGSAPSPEAPPSASPARPRAKDRVLLVTGMSGAGHSSALKALEDIGYEAVEEDHTSGPQVV